MRKKLIRDWSQNWEAQPSHGETNKTLPDCLDPAMPEALPFHSCEPINSPFKKKSTLFELRLDYTEPHSFIECHTFQSWDGGHMSASEPITVKVVCKIC